MEYYEKQLAELKIKLATAQEIDDCALIAEYEFDIENYKKMQSQVH